MEHNNPQQTDRPNRDQETEKKPVQVPQPGRQQKPGQEGQQEDKGQQDRDRKSA